MYGSNEYDADDDANNETNFKITSTKLYVPIVTLSTKDNAHLTKQLNEGFKRSKIETKKSDNNNLTDFILMLLFKELKDCLFLFLIILLLMFLII